jgi:hypothetical protein
MGTRINDRTPGRLSEEDLERVLLVRYVYYLCVQDFMQQIQGKACDEGGCHTLKYDGPVNPDVTSGKSVRLTDICWDQSVWLGLADFCRAADVDPGLWIKAHFEALKLHEKAYVLPPTQPGALISDAHEPAYRAYMSQRRDELRRILRGYWTLLDDEIATRVEEYGLTPERAEQGLLKATMLALSPLFRYAVASQRGHADTVATYAVSAWHEYMPESPLYDEVWGDLIPEALRTRRQHYRDWKG